MELTFYCRKTVDKYMPGIDKHYDQKNRVAKDQSEFGKGSVY